MTLGIHASMTLGIHASMTLGNRALTYAVATSIILYMFLRYLNVLSSGRESTIAKIEFTTMLHTIITYIILPSLDGHNLNPRNWLSLEVI